MVNKNLTIKVNNNDTVTLKPVDVGFNVVNNVTGNGGGTNIIGFIINLLSGGTGINITANDVTIDNNIIKGGANGIITFGNHTVIINNQISGVSNTSIRGGDCIIKNESDNVTIESQTVNNTLVKNNQITGDWSGL